MLDLVGKRRFDAVVVLETPGAQENARALVAELLERHPEVTTETEIVALPDPTDYAAILTRLRGLLARRLPVWGAANLYVSVASGTPQMHAAWVLLVAGGELPARVLHTRPPQFVTVETPAVQEVAFEGPSFPTVRPREAPREVAAPAEDLGQAVAELGIVGEHPALRGVLQTTAQVATAAVPVLVVGETGTGKDLVARLVHRLSGRPNDRFVSVNAAVLTGDLVDSTLFGHEKGAFTGAVDRRAGAFERADAGTLFLDEIGELPLETQAKLLRVLQDGSFERLGGAETLRSDARIVAATNRDLRVEVEAGRFREDLYYRLNPIELRLPPLRERRSDIPALARHLLDSANARAGRAVRLSANALDELRRADWPGNVRQLQGVIERTVLLAPDDVVDRVEVAETNGAGGLPEPHHGFDLKAYVAETTRRLYDRAYEIAEGNKSEAGRLLGVSPAAVSKHFESRDDEG